MTPNMYETFKITLGVPVQAQYLECCTRVIRSLNVLHYEENFDGDVSAA